MGLLEQLGRLRLAFQFSYGAASYWGYHGGAMGRVGGGAGAPKNQRFPPQPQLALGSGLGLGVRVRRAMGLSIPQKSGIGGG